MLGVVFAVLAAACGLAIRRLLRVPLSMAPLCGVAGMVVLTVWCTALGAPGWARSGLIVLLALAGVGVSLGDARATSKEARLWRSPLLLLAGAVITPAVLLGVVFAGVEAPISVHDGAFHVEAVDSLRRGVPLQTWYPMGFHATAAAVLGLVPWVDTARGTAEVAQGLSILAPLAVFSLALALGLNPMGGAIAAAVLALTWIYPYDPQVWGGWPQALGVLLLIGAWTAALRWTQQPSMVWAALTGVFAATIVLSHGTELYSASVGVIVIALTRWRQLRLANLLRDVPVGLGVLLLIVAPYVPTLLGWAGSGGAVGAAELDVSMLSRPGSGGLDEWLQFPLGATGGAVLSDLILRTGLIALGLSRGHLRLAGALWITFSVLSMILNFSDLAPVKAVFLLTYPWLYRVRQVAVVLASVLVAGGIGLCFQHLERLRVRVPQRPATWRRIALAGAVLLAFFAEGSAVSIYKRTAQSIAELGVYSADDGLAMAWLKRNAQPGELLANDQAADAGIWAPYKADIPILLPRAAGESDLDARQSILTNVLDLSASPVAHAEACQLHVRYLYVGAPITSDGAQAGWTDAHLVANRAALGVAPGLEEVFSAGDAAVFRVHLPCA